MNQFNIGDLITITLKLHGTSARTSNTVKIKKTDNTLVNKILMFLKIKPQKVKTYETITGTRRVILDSFSGDGGYYGTHQFRKRYHDYFDGKLKKGESVYYEIVGYVDENTPIMSRCSNKKTQDKQFIKKYGDETVFEYGCNVGENDIYVYRMTMTNEDGDSIEYPTWLAQKRCEEMNVKHVPVLEQFVLESKEQLEDMVNRHLDGEDPVGKTHVREGVVVRVENSDRFKVFKHKCFHFKVLEGIIKDAGVLDMEEQESIQGE